MASTTYTPTFLCSSTPKRTTIFTISASVALCSKTPNFRLSTSVPQLGHSLFSPWNGLKHLGISIRQNSVKTERKRRFKGKVVYASLFGVGAPEALVIGVVALLVFGPKGLAEVARNLGKTLRAFQPTIRELQEVSREFKSTLEREIGLDEIPPSQKTTDTSTSASPSADNETSQASVDPNGTLPTKKPYSSEEYLKTTEEQLKAFAAQQQTLPQEDQSELEHQTQDGASPPNKPFNIGEFLVEAQVKASATQQQEQTAPQEEQYQSEPQPQPQPQSQVIAPEVASSMPSSKKVESEL